MYTCALIHTIKHHHTMLEVALERRQRVQEINCQKKRRQTVEMRG